MTSTPPSAARGENSGTVAIEWIASTAAAIGLLLCLLAAPGGEWGAGGPAGHGWSGATDRNHQQPTSGVADMNLKALLNRFRTEEDGAVTVDWVVLTAGLVVLVGLIGGLVAQGVQTAGQNIATELTQPSSFKVSSSGGDGGGEVVPE